MDYVKFVTTVSLTYYCYMYLNTLYAQMLPVYDITMVLALLSWIMRDTGLITT